jgi:hypothetical protein
MLMRAYCPWFVGVALGVVLAMSWPAASLAQGAPSPLSRDVIGATQPTSEQVQTIKAWADFWTAMFASPVSTPEQIEEARSQLIKPLQGINQAISPAFRFEYSRFVVPALEKVIDGARRNMHAAINAEIVISQLGTDRALAALLSRVSRTAGGADVPWQVRRHAVIGCKTLVASPSLDSRKIIDASRQLRDAARTEDDNEILWRLFEALAAADSAALPQPEDRRTARAALIDAFTGAVDRMAAEANRQRTELKLEAAIKGVELVRQKYLAPPPVDEQREIGAKIAPRLGKLLELAALTWEPGRADPNTQKSVSTLVGACEGFLPAIVGQQRGTTQVPRTQMQKAWNSGDKSRFDADLAAWVNVLKQSP